MRASDLLLPMPQGLYCPPGDFYIDPVSPVDKALITHGHSDHARSGHSRVLATSQTLDIMALRYGERFAGSTQTAVLGETIDINGVSVRFVPAGHVLGSAQIVVEKDGMRIVASGDYKRKADLTCLPFEPVACDVFITEATFGLPVFRHPDDHVEIRRLLHSVAQFPERTHLVGAYALGKAQRVISLLRQAGYEKTIYLHGRWRSSRLITRVRASTSVNSRLQRWKRAIATILPARSSSARRRPFPTAGRGGLPIQSPASHRAGCRSASVSSSGAWSCH
jgi:putative mRNA 3-end processing factor